MNWPENSTRWESEGKHEDGVAGAFNRMFMAETHSAFVMKQLAM